MADAEPGRSDLAPCGSDDCAFRALPARGHCLEHLNPEVLESVFAELKPGDKLDFRGNPLSEDLIQRLRKVMTDPDAGVVIGDAFFDGATFTGDASFADAQFSGKTSFDDARFTGTAWFYGATFTGDARFVGARFSGDAWFRGVTFSGEAPFVGATFSRDARFDRATFSGTATFYGATFTGDAWFVGATFWDASFDGATFTGDARFEWAKFSGNASFDGATFSRNTRFYGTTFSGDARFDEATFEVAENLGPLLARGLDIGRATFGHHVVIEAAASELSAVRTRFQDGATIRLRRAEIVLDGTAFRFPSSVSFVPSPFKRDLEEEKADLFDESLLAEGDPRPRVVSLRQADVSALVLSDLDLSGCLFDGVRNLDHIRVEGSRPFADPPSGWRRSSGPIPLWRWARRQTLAEEHRWRASPKAAGSDEHRLRKRLGMESAKRAGWYPDAVRAPEWLREATDQDPRALGANQIAPLYRGLRKALEDSKNEPGAADFYYGEMEMRRFDPATPWGERAILFVYWLISGYGLRGSRSLACLAALVLGLGTMFGGVGFANGHASFVGALIYTAQATLSIENRSLGLTRWGDVLLIVLRLSGPLFLGLAVLSVRNRVKR